MQRPVGNRWASPQGTEPRFRFNPPQLAGSPSQTGYQRFQQGPQGSALRFANHSFPQQGTRGENRMQFNRDGPLIRPSQFSGPPHGPRPPLNYQQNSGNPFGPVPRFRNFPQNGPPGMMRGPRPDFNFPNGPRFHKAQFNKKKQKQPQKPNNNQQEKKEIKYFCDTCDRGYKEEEKYNEHVAGHEKCRFEGCSYIAAPKLVQLHITWQHKSGMAKKIWSLESAEDIKKWREERKKNFPTQESIAKKISAQISREERGELIEEKYFGKMYGRGRGRGRGRGGRFDRRRRGDHSDIGGTQPKQRKTEEPSKEEDKMATADSVQENQIKSSGGDPLSYILSGAASDDEEEEDSEIMNLSKTGSAPTAAAGLGVLMTSYQDSSSDEDGEVKEIPATVVTRENRLETSQMEDGSRVVQAKNHEDKQETGEGKHEINGGNQREHAHSRRKKRGKKKQQKQKQQPFSRVNKSLLEKLLAKEIRQERNKILQCVHYIVKKDFFGAGKQSSGTTISHSTS